MKITKYLLFVFLLFYSFIHVQGQIPKSDSLWNEFRKAKHDTTKIKLYLEIGDIYEFQLPDTSIVYYQKAIALAEKSLVTSHSLSPIVATTIKKYLASSIRYIGIIYTNQGFYDKGIEFYLKALKISEELGDKKGVSRCYTSIGIVQYYQGNFEKSIGYFLKSINIDKGLGDKKGIAADYTNLGNVYSEMGTFDKALEYYIKSLKIAEELEDKIGMAQCYGNIAIIHEENGFFNKAMEYYQKSLKICEELGDKNGIAIELGNIASLHITLSDSVATTQGEKIKNYNKSINYGLKSLNLANEINAKFLINSAAGNLQKVYKALGNPAKALEYAEIYIATKDSMFNEDKTKALAEMETKYQSEKNNWK